MGNPENLRSDVRFSPDELALGWLLGVTLLSSVQATAGRPHSHKYLEVIFCLRGEFAYALDQAAPVTLRTGMGLVIPERTSHPLRGGIVQPGLRLVFHISPKPAAGLRSGFTTPDLSAILRDLLATAKRPFRLSRPLLVRLKEISDFLRNGTASPSSLDLAHFRTLCEDALFRAARLQTHPLGLIDPRLMEDAVAYLNAHCSEHLPISHLVNRIGYSRSRFFDLFREYTGLSPHEYLVRLRIRKAEELLCAHDAPVREIARAVGFGDYVHFASVFKRYTGRTPTASRLG